MPQPEMTGVIRFGVFELEPQAGILRKHGVRIRLQEQPFRLLLALIEKRGEPVTREELRDKVWAGVAFGDFDHSLNIAINKIREALGDSAESPRFVETLPRRGYRFIAPVEAPATPPAAPIAAAPVRARMPGWIPLAGIALAAVVLITGAVAWLLPSTPPHLEWRRLTNDSSAKVGQVLPDGARLYFRTASGSGLQILQVPVSGGEPTALPVVPPPGPYYQLLDITPNGQELLVVSYDSVQSEGGELWTLRIVDGASRRVGNLLVRVARYSPDGRRILFTAGGWLKPGSLWVASSDGSNARRLLELKGQAIGTPCWSPDGKRVAFGQVNRATGEASAWEVLADGTGLRRLFPDWAEIHQPAGWTPDGHLLLNSRGQYWTVQQPRFFEHGQPRRVQLSFGEPSFAGWIRFRDSRTFYTVGSTPLGQLQRFDTRSRTWEPHLGGISAETVEYSRDRQSVVYATYPEGELWVRRADGSHPVQLTKAPMRASIGRWSPDGRVIAFAGHGTPDQPSRIYLVDAAGGSVRPACRKECEGLDLTWMADGKTIVFDTPLNRFRAAEYYLRLLDVATGEVTKLPGSEGLHSPRMSPDGSTLAALFLSPTGNRLMLYHFSEGVWRKIPQPGVGDADWPSWSHDGESIWYYDQVRGSIVRYHARENRHEDMLKLKVEEMAGLVGFWFNLTPDDEPMILRRRDIQQIYALDWKPR
jgi:DNA-binding winged helix-turn-helix (wHTH) protein/dipeptidyl aminopeptidase/acylaminoacyl peptidase